MKESTKEWLGIKPADLVIYSAFICLVPVYFSSSNVLDILFSTVGFILCLASCWLGMKPHPELGKVNNFIKLIAYPACTGLFVYIVYLNFTAWH